MRCRLHVKKYGKIDLKHLLQFADQPSPILGSTENTTFVHLPKKSKYLKAEGTDTLISAFTSKTGQPVARYTHQIFLIWIFLSERGFIYAFYRPNFKRQT